MAEHDAAWKPLIEALERRAGEGLRAHFWLRDDDATEPTPALDRLLAICERAHVPLVLAVIPQPTGAALADRFKSALGVSVAVHGWSHHNYAGPHEKKQELGPHRPPEVVLGELSEGLARLKTLHGSHAIAMLVPPWNRIHAGLVPDLGKIGFEALSTFGPAKSAPIHTINSNVDLIDWHGTRGCVDYAALVRLIVAQLERPEPVGILGHHLLHDEAAWVFLETLFALTRSFDMEWLQPHQLLKGQA